MISSKELLDKTGISRATLNNYISSGLLSRPLVQQVSGEANGPKLLGYFPDSALQRIELIQQLKREGLSMAEIIARVGAQKPTGGEAKQATVQEPARPAEGGNHNSPGGRPLHLTIDEISYPAYMVNHSFELTWYNDAAREKFLGRFEILPPSSEARNLFLLLLQAGAGKPAAYLKELLRPHLSFAKDRVSKANILGACRALDPESVGLLDSLYNETKTCPGEGIVESPLELREDPDRREYWHFYAAFFREGILFIYVPNGPAGPTLLDFLARRDQVIRDLLRRRLPVLTPLAVLVADLQNSVKICSELPPEEYFELINEMWSTMGPIFRRYYGTHGKHVGDGMVYYFFPQPDSNYIFNAIACAHEVKIAMRKISKDWQLRKNWFNELYLNAGLNEGQEWLGTFQSATAIEFAVLGDTINHAGRLSDFARYGSIWATKAFLSRLSPEERARIEFGIVRRGDGNREQFVASSYAQLGSLVDLTSERYEKLREIATLPICEIRSVSLVRKAVAQPPQ